MAIDFVGGKYANLAAQSLLRLSQVSAAPNFEVRFNAAQNAALDGDNGSQIVEKWAF